MKKIGLGGKLMFGGAIIVSIPMLVVSSFLILKSTSTLSRFLAKYDITDRRQINDHGPHCCR